MMMKVMPELNLNDLDLLAASEKEDVFVERGPSIAITSDGTTGGGEELASNLEPQSISPAEAGRAERSAQMREGMSRNGGYLGMDGQGVCHSPTIGISTYVC